MPTITFHNIGNADCIRIDLDNDKKILFDYANRGDPSDENDLRCDLPAELRKDLGERDNFDVVAFTHLDKDHYDGATEFFYFDHIGKYQDKVNGEPRIKMKTMWVPAAVITEALPNDADVEAKAIQKEARERFKARKGIRVFSRPSRLKEWCEKNDIDFGGRKHLVTDAGGLVKEFDLTADGVEFFVHSPFAKRQDECTVEDRNNDAIVMHATFVVDGVKTKLFLASDIEHDVIADIVTVTESKKRTERLVWDVFNLSHHCSYKSLGPEKGEDKTKPVPKVEQLFEAYGQDGGILVSTSDTIPLKGDERDKQDGANPPHRQAANYYKENVAGPKDGEFKVTMEHPSKTKPGPLVIEIDSSKARIVKRQTVGVAAAINSSAPRAG